MEIDLNLIGKTVTEIRKSLDGTYLDFMANDERQKFIVQGTADQESWLAHASGVQNLLNNTVDRIVERKKITDIENRECIFAYDFYTSSGICSFEMRSNGGDYYMGVISENRGEEPQDMEPITRDF